jgi:hypothetical protein
MPAMGGTPLAGASRRDESIIICNYKGNLGCSPTGARK